MEQSIQDRYFELLKSYVDTPKEEFLAAVAGLGRELVVINVPPEDIVEIHEHALVRLAQEKPNLTLQDAVPEISTPLMELLMIHGLAFRERSEARERAEAALRASEDLLRRVIDTSPNCVFVKDGNGKYILVNEATAELYGMTPEKIVGMTDRDLAEMSKISMETAEGFMADDQQVIVSKQPKFIPEEPFMLPDGTTRWFQITKMPLVGRNVPDSVLVVAVDITERKRTEELIRQQERLAAVGQLATGVALDFNNLMTSIILNAQVLKDQPDLSSDLSSGLEIILGEAQRASGLVVQILDLSRRSLIGAHPVDLKPLIEESVETLQQTLPENIRILVEMGQEEYVVNADPTRVQRIVMNLAVNAGDAMPEGGEIRIGLSRLSVWQGAEPPVAEMAPGEWVCITVSDTGFSIIPEDLPYIFEPFFTTKALGRRMGLELAQVYGIVMQHGGHIEVKTTEERGATFRIYLPARDVEDVEEIEKVEDALTISRGRGETILLVEDEKNIQLAGKTILETMDYRVLTAANGQEALEVYQAAEGVDLVVTDLVMPEMGGKELVRELRKINPGLKALAITGYVSPEALQELIDEGFRDVVPKPFTMDTLVKTVYRALSEG